MFGQVLRMDETPTAGCSRVVTLLLLSAPSPCRLLLPLLPSSHSAFPSRRASHVSEWHHVWSSLARRRDSHSWVLESCDVPAVESTFTVPLRLSSESTRHIDNTVATGLSVQ